jgi:glycosyltransferase involved in cell wall biosynthesis
MDTPPLFSVVTVTLNCREDALTTAQSVWAQEGVDVEYVVKDGGSRDGTVEAIRAGGGPVQIAVAPDTGIYDAMNQAIRLCHGRYILFLNGGDTFRTPTALHAVAQAIAQNNEPEVLYTYNHNVLRRSVVKYPARLGRFYLYRRSVNHQATYVRRDCFERFGGFDTSFPEYADNEVLARLLLGNQCRSALCPTATVNYRDGGFSVQAKHTQRRLLQRQRIRERYFTRSERFWFGLLHGLSLFPLRQRWLAAFPSSPLTRVYYRLANAFNQTLGRH